MWIYNRRQRVEQQALLLSRAMWFLSVAVKRFSALGDSERAERITRVIEQITADRDRWLELVDSPLRWAFALHVL